MKKISGKRAWLRIVEAFIAIILIASVLIILYTRTIEKPESSEEIYKLQKTILDELASNPELRDSVLSNNEEKINGFVEDKVPAAFNFTIRICEVEDICSLPYYKQEVYSNERIISATLTIYEPKKVKIFMWRE